MTARPFRFLCAAAVALTVTTLALAQEPGKTKDAALDSLLDELKKDGAADPPPSKKAATKADPAQSKSASDRSKSAEKATQKAGASSDRTKAASKAKPLAPKDQALDDLLGKLGESKDEPAPEERPRNSPPGAGDSSKDKAAAGKDASRLGGSDKEIDSRLEELAGRKRKRSGADDEQRTGPVGEMIKEMRDVEKRLGKPDTSEDTQAKQKQIVKRIDTLIEQVRQSGASAGRLVLRRRNRQGDQPGQQEGDQTGALAQGAPPMKPAKPTSQHSTAGGKGAWGHLPPELRQIMENSFKEEALTSKTELISRYFTSVGKGKPIRDGE